MKTVEKQLAQKSRMSVGDFIQNCGAKVAHSSVKTLDLIVNSL